MVSGALAEKQAQLAGYARRLAAMPDPRVAHVEAEVLQQLSAILRDVEEFLDQETTRGLPDTPDLADLITHARSLHQRIARILAVAGLDASWGVIGVDHEGHPLYNAMVLSPSDSTLLGQALDNPPQPNERLRRTADVYRAITGQ